MAAKQYKFMAYTLLGNAPIEELPLYGVYMQSLLNDVAQFSALYQLGPDPAQNQILKDATRPGRTVVYCYEDEILVESYIIWTRTYQGTSRTVQMTGQTLESYPYKNIVRTTFEYNNVEQGTILSQIWSNMLSNPASDISIVRTGLTGVGPLMDFNCYPKEFRYYGDIMEEIRSYRNGIDIKISPRIAAGHDAGDAPVRQLYVNPGRPLQDSGSGSSFVAGSNIVFEFPGNLSNYWYTEGAADAATRVFATSDDRGWETVVAPAIDATAFAAGYPEIEKRFIYPNISKQSGLQSRADQKLAKFKVPVTKVSMDIAPADAPPLSSIILGDKALFAAQDEFFPNGHTEEVRIIGWDISLGDGGIPNTFNLTLAGENNDG